MKVLIVDVETTGLNYKTDNITEIAAITANLSTKKIENQVSGLIYTITNPEAEKITGITQEMLDSIKYSDFNPFDLVNEMVKMNECIVAHNAQFDRSFLKAKGHNLGNLEWICSYKDIKYNINTQNKKLATLAEAYNISSEGAHRSLADVMMVANILFKIDGIENQIKNSLINKSKPLHLLKAEVSYDQRNLAKQAGFNWNPAKKSWLKSEHANFEELEDLIHSFPFKVKYIYE